ncbi:unnamed protein product [Vitrella brassicaformis CCMP3155]|uniref:Uncharacterized protein n=1 Tax=Vitrella brassicaformis (strain CCMP3155) TaxID=1169540 RepID=A0A0G4EQM5_VITBC|nr:unnamed protein product [Vitrella brassicaformis CCMP3155]|eukprot:CEM00528.1 unnamed protein product [Vitrella brassicaformis CCMP3155]
MLFELFPACLCGCRREINVDPTPEDLVARPPCAPSFFIDEATEERSPLGVQCCTAAVQEGDIVIAATDGVFDNIKMDGMLDIIGQQDKNDAEAIAQAIGRAAYSRSLGRGGKKDDVTVVVGVVCGGAVTEADGEVCIAGGEDGGRMNTKAALGRSLMVLKAIPRAAEDALPLYDFAHRVWRQGGCAIASPTPYRKHVLTREWLAVFVPVLSRIA